MDNRDAGQKLRTMALLGAFAEQETQNQIKTAAAHKDKLTEASIQVAAAQTCIEEALKIITTIPGSEGWMLVFMLRTDVIRLQNMSRQLGYVGGDNG